MKKIIHYLILLSILSCTNKSHMDFENNIDLKGDDMPINNVRYFGYHRLVTIMDSLMLTKNIYDKSKVFDLVNIKDFSHVASFGDIGRGPKQVVRPGSIIVNESSKKIYVLDLGRYQFFELQIKKKYEESIFSKSDIVFEKKFEPYGSIDFFNDSTLVFSGNTGGHLIYLANKEGELIDMMGSKFYEKTMKMHEFAYADATTSEIDVKPDGTKIIVGYRLFDRLICLNKNGETIFDIEGDDLDPNIEDRLVGEVGFTSRGLPKAYLRLRSTNNHIFALYGGRKLNNNKDHISSHGKTIRIFDWEGTPVMKINLDYEIFDFIIDHENQRFICFSHASENPFIVYKFPDNLID